MKRLSLDKQPPRLLLALLIVIWLLVVGLIGYCGWRTIASGAEKMPAEVQRESASLATSMLESESNISTVVQTPVPVYRRIWGLFQRSTPTPTVTPTSTPTPIPTLTPSPTLTPTPVPPEPPFPTPVVDLTNRSIYTMALRPQSAGEAEAVPDAAHYFIQAMLIPDTTPLITGIERVRYVNQLDIPLDEIYFRLYPNLPAYEGSTTIHRTIVDSQLVTPTLEASNSALRIPLARPLQPGEVTDITLWFNSTLPTTVRAGSAGTGLYGFYQGVYDLAGFYPTLAVYDHNGWNLDVTTTFGDSTFTEIAFYHVQLTMPSEQEVVASGTTIDRRNNGDGTHTWHILAGPARAFYAASSARYQYITQMVDDIAVNSYYLDGGLSGAQTALNYATGSLAVFSDLFGDYPYLELDVIAMPTTGFGMEYPGVIAIANRFYGEGGGAYAEAVVHEVAHQWWYNLVGNDQPNTPWLDESLSNYSYYLYFEAIGWTELRDAIMNNDFLYRYNAARNLGIDRPVGGPVIGFTPSNYINIVYSKGPLFLHEVRKRIGDQPFFAALRDYADTHRYGIAYPADLMDAFARHSDQPILDLYNFWIGDDALAQP
jgi:hypothetical protein